MTTGYRLSTDLSHCPLCGNEFQPTDADVRLYQLQFNHVPLLRGETPQVLTFRLHTHCIDDYPCDCMALLAGLYVTPDGIGLCEEIIP